MNRTLSTLLLAIASALMLLLSSAANARCITGPWLSTNKTLHAVGNATIVLGTDAAFKQWAPETFEAHPYIGLIPAIALSTAREVYKTRHGGSCEYASMTYDALGMAVGAAGTHWLLLPQPHGLQVSYSKSF
jgi:hypothetical protein